jgi:hypothetical protein
VWISQSVEQLGCGLDEQGAGFQFGTWATDFLSSVMFRPALGLTQSPVRYVLGLFPWGKVKHQGHEAVLHLHLASRLLMVELYLHFYICLYDVMLYPQNWTRTSFWQKII